MKKHIRYKKNRYKGTYTFNNVTYLSKADSKFFTNLLLNPPEPNDTLKALFKEIASWEEIECLNHTNK